MNLQILSIRLLLDPLLKPFWDEVRLVLELPTLETPHDNCIYLYVKEGVPCFSITGHKAQYFIQDYTPVIEKYSLKFVDLESQVSLCRN